MRFGLDNNGKIIILLPIFQIPSLIFMIFSRWCCISPSGLNLQDNNPTTRLTKSICTYDVCPLSVPPSCPLLPSPLLPISAWSCSRFFPVKAGFCGLSELADDLNGSSRSAPSVCVCLCGHGHKLPFEYLNFLARHSSAEVGHTGPTLLSLFAERLKKI